MHLAGLPAAHCFVSELPLRPHCMQIISGDADDFLKDEMVLATDTPHRQAGFMHKVTMRKAFNVQNRNKLPTALHNFNVAASGLTAHYHHS